MIKKQESQILMIHAAKVQQFFDICKTNRFLGDFCFLSFLEALWGIREVYAEYSWGIHGIYVCIGYVSGMYRVCIGTVSKGTGRVGGGMPTTDEHGWTWKHGNIMKDNIDNLRPNQYPLGATRGMDRPRMSTDGHGKKEYRHPCSQTRRNNRSTEGR